ncbi:MAG: DUF58 domain-containing protein [Bacteroidota bacterium]|nr:DUF58 domain-containing protein [Bacteroidota bacterium]
MNRYFSKIRLILKRIGFYLPFTIYFVLFLICVFLGYRWLNRQANIPDSGYKDVFSLLLTIALGACVFIICFGFISVLAAFVFIKLKQKNNKIDFQINQLADNKSSIKRHFSIKMHPVLKPLLGFIKVRLNYDDTLYSEKFSLIKEGNFTFFNLTVNGVYNWNLPEIREYKVQKAIIYFEDFFQFFSLAVRLNTNKTFNTLPETESVKELKPFPRKTEETVTRIEELKKVEGELINYKNFESNDDVRRIVWKIYAKNKELVVRIPEIMDPYASHIYLYNSFYSSINVSGNEIFEIPFLNYYKTACWSLYKQLLTKGLEVRTVSDQPIPNKNFSSQEEQIQYAITDSKWQNEVGLKEYIKTNNASIVVISSLSNLSEVKELLDQFGNQISFVFVSLTESFKKQRITDWMTWLFLQKEKDKTEIYKTNWAVSTSRSKVIENEKEIKELLNKYEKSVVYTIS